MTDLAKTVSRADCDAALPHVLAAPKDETAIATLCRRTGYSQRSFPDQITVSAARGIEGERWLADPWLRLPDGSPDPRIQVSILPLRVYDLCCRMHPEGLHPGDTMIADLNTSEANLPNGTRLAVGSAVLEVSDKFNTGCQKWLDRYGEPSLRWIVDPAHRTYRLRGVLCRVVADGVIAADDRIKAVR